MNPLAKYLKRNYLTVGAFARMSRLDKGSVWRIVHNQRNCGMLMASRIAKATAGEVPISAWSRKTPSVRRAA